MTDTQDLIKQIQNHIDNFDDPNASLVVARSLMVRIVDALAAHQEVLQSFVDNQIEYMRVNNLGDGEKQHNVKWARKVMGTQPPKED